jgi:hypothetical protein
VALVLAQQIRLHHAFDTLDDDDDVQLPSADAGPTLMNRNANNRGSGRRC